jgi:hypothetical protein
MRGGANGDLMMGAMAWERSERRSERRERSERSVI